MIPRRKLAITGFHIREWFRALFSPGEYMPAAAQEFEAAFAAYLGVKYACATSSGRDAIALALSGMGLQAGDEILFPAYSLGELVPFLQSAGYKIVPIDVDPDTFNIDLSAVKAGVSVNTKAIVLAHILGAPCDIEEIMKFATERSILVLEDCAHALGAKVNGRKVGSFGDAAIFSLEVNKGVPTYGGGMLVTGNHAIYSYAVDIISSRKKSKYPALKKALSTWVEEIIVRSPFYGLINRILFSDCMASLFESFYRGSHGGQRMQVAYSGYQAMLGLKALSRIDDRNMLYNQKWSKLTEALADSYKCQKRDLNGDPAFYNLVIMAKSIAPSELRKKLRSYGIDVGIGTEVMDNCAGFLDDNSCPVAEKLVRRGVLVPLYEGLKDKELDKIVKALNELAKETPPHVA